MLIRGEERSVAGLLRAGFTLASLALAVAACDAKVEDDRVTQDSSGKPAAPATDAL